MKLQLAALEALNEAPVLSLPVPIASAYDDDMVTIPPSVAEYLKKTGQFPELEPDGRLHIEKYRELMNASGIPSSHMPWVARYTIITPEKSKAIQNGKR